MLRQLLIVIVLFWAMSQADVFSALHDVGIDPSLMASLGFIVLAGYTLGELAGHFKLPHISGYLLAGVACGDHFLGLLSHDVVASLKIFDILAIALIAMEAGAQLDIDGLRQRWRAVAVLTTVMIVLCTVGGYGFAGLTSGAIEAIALPFLAEGGPGVALAAGGLFAVMILAASPPVTLAVISESKAKGPFTDTLLTSVIINNIQVVVLFAVAVALGHAFVGSGAGHGGGAGAVLEQLAWSLVLGVIFGGLAAVNLRFIRDDAAIAIVGICFVGSFVAEQVGASQLMTFLTAGALLTTATRQGTPFKRVATTLSGPVYVVFFTLVGADLHIDALIKTFPFAIAIVLMRLGAYFLSVRLSNRMVPLGDGLAKYGFLGLAPQAGIALTIAIGAKHEFVGWGHDFETLGLAAIALNEMVGPVLLKVALSLAGEAGKGSAHTHDDDTAEPEELPAQEAATDTILGEPAWLRDLADDALNTAPDTGIPILDQQAFDLATDLRDIVAELEKGPLGARQEKAQAFLQSLRRELLRTHRTLQRALAQPKLTRAELARVVSAERGRVADRCREHLLAHGASVDLVAERRAIDATLLRIKTLVGDLPMAAAGPMDPALLSAAPGDGPGRRLRKATARIVRALSGGNQRVVPVRALGRYHLEGDVPGHMVEFAEHLVAGERRLLGLARALLGQHDQALRGLRLVDGQGQLSPTERASLVSEIHTTSERSLQHALDEVDAIANESRHLAWGVLAYAYSGLLGHARLAGSPALPPREYRYSAIYARARAAQQRFETLWDEADRTIDGKAGALAMELELQRLHGQIDRVAEEAALDVAHAFHRRVIHRLDEVQAALAKSTATLQAVLADPPKEARDLLDRVDAVVDPAITIVEEAVTVVDTYRHELEGLRSFDLLMGHIVQAVDALSDRTLTLMSDEDGPSQRTIEVPFRKVVRSVLEADVGRDLASIGDALEAQLDAAFKGLVEVDRVLLFNRELARTELEVLGDGPVSPQAVDVAEQTLLATMRRLGPRVVELQQHASPFHAKLASQALEAVVGNLGRVQADLVAGTLIDDRGRVSAARTGAADSRSRGVGSQLVEFVRRSDDFARATVGSEALERAQRFLGLSVALPDTTPGPQAFAPPAPHPDVPVTYRRLFSDRSLEAGDLLVGHEARVAELRRVLVGRGPGSSRAVAIVGVSGPGSRRLVSTLFRGISDDAQVLRHSFEAPGPTTGDLDTLEEQVRHAQAGMAPPIVVVDGFRWLFTLEPGGFAPLRRFVELVVATRHQVGWLVSCDAASWHYLDRVVPVDAAFPERLKFVPFDVASLRRALLSRHAMSGYRVRFARPERRLQWWLRELFASKEWEHTLYEEGFFARIHKASGGNLPDALRLWMASIKSVDSERDLIEIGALPPPRVDALRHLDDDTLLALRQAVRQGRLGEDDFAHQFRLSGDEARARLAQLDHWGLVVPGSAGSFRIRPELDGAIHIVLTERRLVS